MDRIEELRRLEREATPGRWVSRKIEDAKDDWWSIDAPGDPPSLALVGPEDAAFIAAARNAMPLLLEVVEAARKVHLAAVEADKNFGVWPIGLFAEAGGLGSALAALDSQP